MRKTPPTKPLRLQFTYDGHRYSVTGHTQKELHARYEKKLAELKKGHFDSDTMVAKWADTWLETYKEGKVSDTTYRDYKMYVDLIVMPIPMGEVRPLHLQRILNQYEGKSLSFLKKLRITIQSMFKQAVHDGIIEMDPSTDLMLPKGTEGTNRALTVMERSALLKIADYHRGGMLLKIMYYCGLRPSEVTRVEGRDIDLNRKLLHVRGTKTKAADRYVPIPEALIGDIQGYEPFEPVLQNRYGERASMRSVRRMWREIKDLLADELGAIRNDAGEIQGINPVAPDLKLYCLRHDYATRLQDAGVPINVARYLLGHADISTTSKIYTHTSDTSIADAAAKINNLVDKNSLTDSLTPQTVPDRIGTFQ